MDRATLNIYNDLLELSDINLQRKLWLNQNNDTEEISSYVELMCRLFDDDGFDNFIDDTALKIGMKTQLILELDKLRTVLNNYKQKESDEEIISDPFWQKIIEHAKRVITDWRNAQLSVE